MKELFIFILFLFVIQGMGFLVRNKEKPTYDFMSFEHSNAYRAVSALIIMLQHVAGSFGVRYLTPLGGVGVAVFLISSGYGLNESYKRCGVRGYWKPKIIRVLIPYLIIIVACYGFAVITRTEFDFPYYWYLDFMLFWYVVFYGVIGMPGGMKKGIGYSELQV